MHHKFIILPFLCLVIFFSSSLSVLASSKNSSFPSEKNNSSYDNSSYSEENAQSGDSAITRNFLQPFGVIWKFCTSANIRIGSISFSFAEFWLYQILLGVVIWFIRYVLFD